MSDSASAATEIEHTHSLEKLALLGKRLATSAAEVAQQTLEEEEMWGTQQSCALAVVGLSRIQNT